MKKVIVTKLLSTQLGGAVVEEEEEIVEEELNVVADKVLAKAKAMEVKELMLLQPHRNWAKQRQKKIIRRKL